ncbi:hypothetical protein A1O3_01342 [Capronia epimyces CBS 606.96]|uniref:RGS domain-containing protein n=1 Tax=Capronia epimyces CBS 606.96 TaxID=1182542 RepID=W9YSX9_9EURO|nr:uncharacterized protein A1O3_01342 [Capronia epimyces CBS 606.96]EXJ92790.1 hypothetical protein A1O3_01342 [Capronia epimyces CBS 606.96]
MGLNPKGRNWGTLVNWDDLAKFYAGFILAWTVILYAGVTWLIYNRHLAFIKIRNLPLAIASVTSLHIYLIKIFLAYTTNGHFPCAAEFWIMSVYLPCGIALFQANLMQLKSISEQQKGLLLEEEGGSNQDVDVAHPSFASRWWSRWTHLPGVKRTYILIALGMTVQLIVTGILYATTPTLQGDWASYGHISHAKGQALCRKSQQWIPSAFWQLVWAWVYGPYLLFGVRNITDTHSWKLQVMLSVISGLPGAPLWIAAVFSTAFKPVNIWWVPPMWLAPGIIVMQLTTVFFPVYEIWKSSSQMRTTRAILNHWEEQRAGGGGGGGGRGCESIDQHHLAASSSIISSGDTSLMAPSTSTEAPSRRHRQLCSMASLEKALAVNPYPLLYFAATKDFSAEHVLFLIQVRRWRQACDAAPRIENENALTTSARARLFSSAVEIYTSRVNHKSTECPINIEAKIRRDLDAIFSPAVPTGHLVEKNEKIAVGFTSESQSQSHFQPLSPIQQHMPPSTRTRHTARSNSEDTLFDEAATAAIEGPFTFTHPSAMAETLFKPHPAVSPLGGARAIIRPGFDEHVFDAAEASVKYLVLTNTWQKFVKFGEHNTSGLV